MGVQERSGTATVEGRVLGWRVVGEGQPLLLINGYAATAADWDPTFLEALGGELRVICPDNRGMRESELGVADELTVAAMAEDMIALLDSLGVARATVAGWSMGGFVAQELATMAPDRVGALVLLSTDPGGPTAATAAPETWASLIDHSGTPREQASRMIALLFPVPVAEVIDSDFGEVVATARAGLSDETLDAQERAIELWHRDERPPPGAAWPPTMIAAGSADVVIPPLNSALLGERYPGSGVEIFDGGGHAFMAQEPVRLAEMIKSFARR